MTANQKEEKKQNGSSGQNKKPENEDIMEKLVEELAHFVCGKLCKYPFEITGQEELETHCMECGLVDFINNIQNEYESVNDFVKSQLGIIMEKYKDIVLCKECIHRVKDKDCQDGEHYWCRNDDGLDGNLEESDGCSKGKRI